MTAIWRDGSTGSDDARSLATEPYHTRPPCCTVHENLLRKAGYLRFRPFEGALIFAFARRTTFFAVRGDFEVFLATGLAFPRTLLLVLARLFAFLFVFARTFAFALVLAFGLAATFGIALDFALALTAGLPAATALRKGLPVSCARN